MSGISFYCLRCGRDYRVRYTAAGSPVLLLDVRETIGHCGAFRSFTFRGTRTSTSSESFPCSVDCVYSTEQPNEPTYVLGDVTLQLAVHSFRSGIIPRLPVGGDGRFSSSCVFLHSPCLGGKPAVRSLLLPKKVIKEEEVRLRNRRVPRKSKSASKFMAN